MDHFPFFHFCCVFIFLFLFRHFSFFFHVDHFLFFGAFFLHGGTAFRFADPIQWFARTRVTPPYRDQPPWLKLFLSVVRKEGMMNLYLVQPRRRIKAMPAKGRLLAGNVFLLGDLHASQHSTTVNAHCDPQRRQCAAHRVRDISEQIKCTHHWPGLPFYRVWDGSTDKSSVSQHGRHFEVRTCLRECPSP